MSVQAAYGLRASAALFCVLAQMARADAIFDDPAVTPNEGFADRPQWVEQSTTPPPMPAEQGLMALDVKDSSNNQYFFDPNSLSIGEDGVTRLSLVVTHRGGNQTITFEGIRCETGAYKLYGIANGAEWTTPQNSPWRAIERSGYKDLRSTLLNVLCSQGFPKSKEKVISHLRYPPAERTW